MKARDQIRKLKLLSTQREDIFLLLYKELSSDDMLEDERKKLRIDLKKTGLCNFSKKRKRGQHEDGITLTEGVKKIVINCYEKARDGSDSLTENYYSWYNMPEHSLTEIVKKWQELLVQQRRGHEEIEKLISVKKTLSEIMDSITNNASKKEDLFIIARKVIMGQLKNKEFPALRPLLISTLRALCFELPVNQVDPFTQEQRHEIKKERIVYLPMCQKFYITTKLIEYNNTDQARQKRGKISMENLSLIDPFLGSDVGFHDIDLEIIQKECGALNVDIMEPQATINEGSELFSLIIQHHHVRSGLARNTRTDIIPWLVHFIEEHSDSSDNYDFYAYLVTLYESGFVNANESGSSSTVTETVTQGISPR